MTHCLVSFLGNSQLKQGVASYHEVDYRFPDGQTDRAAFFGFPLQRHIKADKLVIFGTTGSMWDHLFDGIGVDDEATHEQLLEQVENDATTQNTLDILVPVLEHSLGCTVRLQLIPAAFAREEQTRLLGMLADAAEGATELSLDVTHGYRHMPMLTFAAALYLRTLRPELKIKGLWYGYIDGTVSNLDGLLETADWLSVLQRDQLLGDYEGVAAMVENHDNGQLAQKLRSASHYQNIHQEYKAIGYVEDARKTIRQQGLQGPGELFRNTLLKRMSWASESSRYMQQRSNALNALQRKDYMRASLIGYEAFKTLQVQEYFDEDSVFNEELRDRAVGRFLNDAMPKDKHKFTLLSNIRNVIAHANRPEHSNPKAQEAIEKAIKTQDNLHNALSDCFNTLLPDSK